MLTKRGERVTLFDKARGPGGRLSTRRVPTEAGEAQFDHGATLFTATTHGFGEQLARWESQGLTARWPAAGNRAYVGVPGMNAPVKALADGQRVHWQCRIEAIAHGVDGWRLTGDPDEGRYARLILAIPPEQASLLLETVAPDLAALAARQVSQPCWTLLVAYDPPLATQIQWLEPAGGPVARIARNRAKPGRSGPDSWVIQATAAWSSVHLEQDGEAIAAELLPAFFDAIEVSPHEPLLCQAHRWRYARASGTGVAARWDSALNLGICGDWMLGPTAEHAWESGQAMAGLLTGASTTAAG